MFKIDPIVYGVLIAAGLYTLSVNIICLIIVRKWYMFCLFLLSIILIVVIAVMYWKKSEVLVWLGNHYDVCYIQCQASSLLSSLSNWM